MSNFNFLLENPEYSVFSNIAVEAEGQFYKSTVFCCFAARKTVEQAVKWIYSIDSDLRKPYDDGIQVLVHDSSFKKLIPSNIASDIQTVIKAGNNAVHSNITIEKQGALFSLKSLFNFLLWIDYTYGAKYEQRTFEENKIPGKVVKIAIKKNSSEIHLYKEQLEAQQKTIQELKELLAQNSKEIESRKNNNKPELKLEDLSEFNTRKYFIDEDLKIQGWQLDKVMVYEEYPLENLRNTESNKGFIDYLLFGPDKKPLAIVEAKKSSVDPNVGKQQAQDYATAIEEKFGIRPFIFYTNGFDCYFWDDLQHPPRQVSMIFSQDDLIKLMQRRSQKKNLNQISINEDISGRYYQISAIKSVIDSINNGGRKFLLVMATGTGKTRTAVSLVDVLSRANYIKNILFMADRTELVKQAYDSFKEHLPSMSICNMLDCEDRKKHINARVIFSTYPTMLNAIDSERNKNNNKFFTPAHFDLIIIDEAHRSIFKKYGAIFQYFDSYLTGLTATPRADVDHNTYDFFELQNNNPTYVYEYQTAIDDHFLVPFYNIENTSKFMDEGITYDSLSEEDKEQIEDSYAEEGTEFDEVPPAEIMKYVFTTDTIDKVITDLMQNGIKTGGGDRIGKTIIFAYNKTHAQAIIDRFNILYPQYKGNCALRVVCSDSKVHQTISDFKKAEQNPFIVVSVDMLDTGVDVPEVVNLVFFKKVRSKIKFWQMIGRGTRPCSVLECTDGQNENYIGKKYFYIFDYLRNFEFFRENKDGIEGRAGKSLSENIFGKRVQIIQLLQDSIFNEEKYIKLRNELVDIVFNQINSDSLNPQKTPVHLVLKHLIKFQKIEAFQNLSEDDVETLKKYIAPLVFMDDVDEYAKSFDNIVYSIIVAVLQNEKATMQRSELKNISNNLLKKTSIPQVKEHLELLNTLTTDDFYENAGILDYENVRKNIRDLIKFLIDNVEHKIKFVSFVDTITNLSKGQTIEAGDNFEEYKKKVNAYIEQHLNDEAINKLRTNQKLTHEDFVRLNKIFLHELGNKELFEQASDGKSLGVFIRSIAKMDKEAANSEFSLFINNNNLNINQINFVQKIIDNVVEQGEIDLESLADGRPPFDRPQKFFDLFAENEQETLISIIRNINENAEELIAA